MAALPPRRLARGAYPVTEIVRRLLVETGILVLDQPPGEPAFWERFDLSVTVQHDQRTLLCGTFPNPATGELEEEETLFSTSLFPLLNHRFRVGDTQAQEEAKTWFPGDYTDYVLDFQWSSLTNLQFFRLKGRRVRIS